MAAEREFIPKVELRIIDNPMVAPKVSNIACNYFGDGYWSCPADCPNISLRNDVDPSEAALQCAVISKSPGDLIHSDILGIGVSIRQPGLHRSFITNPNSRNTIV